MGRAEGGGSAIDVGASSGFIPSMLNPAKGGWMACEN